METARNDEEAGHRNYGGRWKHKTQISVKSGETAVDVPHFCS